MTSGAGPSARRVRCPVVVLGAGPAGLGAAFRLGLRGDFDVTVLERADRVGGNAGSFEVEGMRVDFGSHRLHAACPAEVLADVRRLLGPDLLERPRHGRIRLEGRWVRFPLRPWDAAGRLPLAFLGGVAWDAITRPLRRSRGDTFAGVLESGLGRTICRHFYFPYAEKIWGRRPEELDAEQARRRVSAGSVGKIVRRILRLAAGGRCGKGGHYFYPKQGYGQISEALQRAALDAGARILLGARVTSVETDQHAVIAVKAEDRAGETRYPAQRVLSTIPLPHLARALRPAAPGVVLEAAERLRYRAMVLVYLVLETDRFTEFDAHYFPERAVTITRLSEPKNYGLADWPGATVLCAEVPCFPEDRVWSMSDEELGRLVQEDLSRVDLPVRAQVRRVVARRLAQAYPVYTAEYRRDFDCLDRHVAGIEGLVTLGRQGLFAHDNTHHTLAMAYAASACYDGEGGFDGRRWSEHRREFESHVVED